MGSAERLGGIGDQRHPVLRQKGHDGGVVGGLPVDVDRDANGVLAGVQSLCEQIRVHVPAIRGAVDEDGSGPDITDRIEGGGEGEAGDENPIALPDAKQKHGEMKRGRAAGEGNTVGPVGNRRQLRLEGVDLGPERGDPTPFEGTVEGGLVGQSGVRRGQIDTAHRIPVRLTGILAV